MDYWYRSFLEVNEEGTFTIITKEYDKTKKKGVGYTQGYSKTLKQSLTKVVEYANIQIKALEEHKEKNGSVGTPKSYDIQIESFKRAIQSIVS